MTVLEKLELIEEQARFKGNEVHKNLAPGANHEEIDRCQDALDFLLPMSLKRLLLKSNGFSVVVENAKLDGHEYATDKDELDFFDNTFQVFSCEQILAKTLAAWKHLRLLLDSHDRIRPLPSFIVFSESLLLEPIELALNIASSEHSIVAINHETEEWYNGPAIARSFDEWFEASAAHFLRYGVGFAYQLYA